MPAQAAFSGQMPDLRASSRGRAGNAKWAVIAGLDYRATIARAQSGTVARSGDCFGPPMSLSTRPDGQELDLIDRH
jgi:hypothetical protein